MISVWKDKPSWESTIYQSFHWLQYKTNSDGSWTNVQTNLKSKRLLNAISREEKTQRFSEWQRSHWQMTAENRRWVPRAAPKTCIYRRTAGSTSSIQKIKGPPPDSCFSMDKFYHYPLCLNQVHLTRIFLEIKHHLGMHLCFWTSTCKARCQHVPQGTTFHSGETGRLAWREMVEPVNSLEFEGQCYWYPNRDINQITKPHCESCQMHLLIVPIKQSCSISWTNI